MIAALLLAVVLRFAAAPSPSGSTPPAVPVLVEGVAASAAAAPVAALRSIWERVTGISFSVLDGRYAELEEGVLPPAVDTRSKRLVEIKELPGGLFRAVLEVAAPAALLQAQDRLRELTVQGEAPVASDLSLLAARSLAREDALEKAALAAAAEVYPLSSVPRFLEGRIVYLETIREGVEGGVYRLTARVKVELATP